MSQNLLDHPSEFWRWKAECRYRDRHRPVEAGETPAELLAGTYDFNDRSHSEPSHALLATEFLRWRGTGQLAGSLTDSSAGLDFRSQWHR